MHLKGANSMAVSGLVLRSALVGTGCVSFRKMDKGGQNDTENLGD